MTDTLTKKKIDWQKIVSVFIMGSFAFIFAFDTLSLILGDETISEQITEWINNGNQFTFGAIVVLLVVHFVFGKYKKD